MRLKTLLFVLFLLLLSACGDSGGDAPGATQPQPEATIRVQCVDLYNGAGGSSRCPGAVARLLERLSPFGTAYAVEMNVGPISRSQRATNVNQTLNTYAEARQVYWELRFATGCNGERDWLFTTGTISLPPGEQRTIGGALQCSAMPYGPNRLTLSVYEDATRARLVDRAIVTFVVVE